MSAAERLRNAASLLRQNAGDATQGAWKSWGMDLLADPIGNSNVDDGIPVVRGLVADGQRPRTFNISYIQTMQPRVGFALADSLDATAEMAESGEGQWRFDLALAVADAILGDFR